MTAINAPSERPAPAAPERARPPRHLGNDIHIWSARIDAPVLQNGWLGQREQERVDRYRRPIDQQRFTAGRALLRRALAYYCGLEPQTLRFGESRHGKPYLKDESGPEFNLSHAGQLVACAVARAPCGIDVEPIRHLPDSQALAKRICGVGDYEHWCAQDSNARDVLLFRHWVMLEAWSKANGRGLTGVLDQRGARCAQLWSHPRPCVAWWQPEPGYWLATVADQRVRCIERVRWWSDSISRIA